MGSSMERSYVHVEGDDDLYTLVHLLIRNGIDYDSKPWPDLFPEFKPIGNDVKVLSGMETAIQAATNRSIGFVIDANSNIQKRWDEIRQRLIAAQVDELPKTIPSGGFVGKSKTYRATVGVWIMPDNEHDGQLEDFLTSLIKDDDPLIGLAEESTDEALKLGATFRKKDRVRAVVRTWLAWQKEPGHPYGRAIQQRSFQRESEIANRFVTWFKQLFSISE